MRAVGARRPPADGCVLGARRGREGLRVMKWLLCCYAGMTTSMLAVKLEEETASRGLDVKIEATPIADVEGNLDGVSAILLGPHVRFAEGNVREAAGPDMPIYVIPAPDFGTMNAKAIIDAVMGMLPEA